MAKAPIPEVAPYGPEPAGFKSVISQRLNWGRLFWKPLHDRMDYGMVMYLLLDPVQQMKPVGYRRFISNDPRTAIDSAVNILTRNQPFWRIDMAYDMAQRERESVGKIERGLAGIIDDLDMMFLERGDGGGNFWTQACFFALARGAIWGKFMVTRQAIAMGRKSPLLGEFWDPRFVYPNFDGIGLQSVTHEKHSSFNEIYTQYRAKVTESMNSRGIRIDQVDPNSPAIKVEYWSNSREGEPGIYGVMAYYSTNAHVGQDPSTDSSDSSCWLVEPMYHGYAPDALPVIGVPVNGIPLKHKPAYGSQVLASMNARAMKLGMVLPSWHDPNGWVAEWGRSLLTSVEELVPQYNEMVATALQHFTIGTYGTWVFNTQSGELPEWEDGVNARVPLRIGETAQRFEPQPINADAYRILEILREEKQRGTLNGILQANGAVSAQSGIVLQQSINAALNNLNPFGVGLTNFGTLFGGHMLEQLRTADVDALSLVSRGSKSYFRITFDPKADLEDRKYKPEPIFRPSVPEDILLKAQVATLLLNPRMPIMSVITVLDRIFQLEDPEGEGKRMMEDIANRDPILLLDRVADVLAEAGEEEMAARIRQKEFQARYQEQAQMMNLQAQMAQLMQMMQGQAGADPSASGATDGSMGMGGGGQGQYQAAQGDGLASSSGSRDSTGAGAPRPGQGGGGGPTPPDLSGLGG